MWEMLLVLLSLYCLKKLNLDGILMLSLKHLRKISPVKVKEICLHYHHLGCFFCLFLAVQTVSTC